MIKYYILLIIMTLLGSVGSLFIKRVSGLNNVLGIFKDVNLYIGGILYLSAAILNIKLLQVLDYSIVLPLASLTFIWTMVLSHLFLKEKITKKKIGGVILIILGVIFVSGLNPLL